MVACRPSGLQLVSITAVFALPSGQPAGQLSSRDNTRKQGTNKCNRRSLFFIGFITVRTRPGVETDVWQADPARRTALLALVSDGIPAGNQNPDRLEKIIIAFIIIAKDGVLVRPDLPAEANYAICVSHRRNAPKRHHAPKQPKCHCSMH